MTESKLKLIYVDDEHINLLLFEKMFKNDFIVHTESSALSALEYIKQNEIDLVVTDQIMPVMTGLEFLAELQKIMPDNQIKRVMVSGYSPEEAVNEALENNLLHAFVSKPWRYQSLKDILLS